MPLSFILDALRERRRRKLERHLNEARRLTEEGWMTSDHTGIVYKLKGEPLETRVPVQVWFSMHTIIIGVGYAAAWDREKRSNSSR